MAKKRILASILASLGAFTSSMAHGKRPTFTLLMAHGVKRPTFTHKTSYSSGDKNYRLRAWKGRYPPGGNPRRRWEIEFRNRKLMENENSEKPKKKFSKSFKDWAEKHVDELIQGSGGATIAGGFGVVGWELYCVYQDDKIRNVTVKNTKDENSKSNGIYHLNIGDRDFFIAFGKAEGPEGNKLIAIFGKDKNEVQQLLKKTNFTKTPKEINLSKAGNADVLKRVNSQFVKKLEDQLRNKNKINNNADNKNKPEDGVKSELEFLIKQCIVPNIISDLKLKPLGDKGFAKFLGCNSTEGLGNKFKDKILEILPDDIKFFDFDISYAKEEKIKHNIGANIFSVPNNSRY